MPFDPSKVPTEHADLFHHGDDGRGLSDEEWDRQKQEMLKRGTYPLSKPDENK